MESLRTKASVKLVAILPIGIFFLVLVQHSPVLVSAQTGADTHLSHREVKNLVQDRYNARGSPQNRSVLPGGSDQAPQRSR